MKQLSTFRFVRGIKKIYREWNQKYPVLWGNLGVFTYHIAKHFPITTTPVLLISLPRSGSSWIGEILGYSSNSLYLREPITQSYRAYGGKGTVFAIDPTRPPLVYKRAADLAFCGAPAFPSSIIIFPAQWSVFHRYEKHLIVKEVNPLALEWFLFEYHPIVIYLTRHPAGVALSYKMLKWWEIPEEEFWQRHGDFQGKVHEIAYEILDCYPNKIFIKYEDICKNPLAFFCDLYQFIGLKWDERVENYINLHSIINNCDDPASTYKNSKAKMDSWRNEITPVELCQLRDAYLSHNVQWYNMIEDW